MDEQLVDLSPGVRVSGRWTITKKLGEGGFGAVYLCQNDQGIKGALKTEPYNARAPLLAMEAQVLRKLDAARDSTQFCNCHDLGQDTQVDGKTGRAVKFNYIVMSLVGTGLDKLVQQAGGRFSPGTAIGICVQMLNALRALHGIGYLHRDIKPANAAIGRPEDNGLRTLYLLDFGMARVYMRPDGTIRRPREATAFRGSPRYASISAHINREYSRKDDLESWFYVMIELYKGKLPFGHLGDMGQIGAMKCLRRTNQPDNIRQKAISDLIGGCPAVFGEILRHIDGLKYDQRPDYNWIMQALRNYLAANNIPEHPYDWESGMRPAAGAPRPSGGGAGSYF